MYRRYAGKRRLRQAIERTGLAMLAIAMLLWTGAPFASAQQTASEPEQFVLYFDFASAKLSSLARPVVADAVEAIKRTQAAGKFSHVKVVGYADTVGSTEGQDRLSIRRSDAVRDELIRNGIEADVIKTEGRGKLEPAVLTGDQVKNPRNRRVRIVIYRPGD
jgi:OmpA-OmpF porin, OOP family